MRPQDATASAATTVPYADTCSMFARIQPRPVQLRNDTTSKPSETDRGPASEPPSAPHQGCVAVDVFEILERVYFDRGSSRTL